MVKDQKKKQGVFLTGLDIASYLVKRVLRGFNQKILEPSFGDGVFINAIIAHFVDFNNGNKVKDDLYGVEIRQEPIDQFKTNPYIDPIKLLNTDFLDTEPFPIDLIIGNPPYVSLNNISEAERGKALKIVDKYGLVMPINGSLWLPFVLHSISHLNEGGSICFVMPFEMTYVKYSRGLWKLLGENFSELTVIRVYEDIFPDVDVETILFIADGYGGKTEWVNYEIYQDKASLFSGKPERISCVQIEAILSGGRPFMTGMLNQDHKDLLERIFSKGLIQPINQSCKFKIGYVCADKKFFHPTDTDIENYGLLENDLISAVANAKILRNGIGLHIKPGLIKAKLFCPNSESLNPPSLSYIKIGEEKEVHRKFKCRNRNPWYVTPGIEIPQIILAVFGDRPRLYINDGGYAASNSLLCGFVQNGATQEQIVASWYNSLTLLSIEIKVHSLGGGVLVFIPGEADAIEVLNPHKINYSHGFIRDLDSLLLKNDLDSAYRLGDKVILSSMDLSGKEIELIRDAVSLLRKWRNAKLRKGAI